MIYRNTEWHPDYPGTRRIYISMRCPCGAGEVAYYSFLFTPSDFRDGPECVGRHILALMLRDARRYLHREMAEHQGRI